ncbi:hypothetical protein [Erythrobacter rubeus]|uniref:Phage shock protein B n=1 Tax=Erythrobacter rubeus TaxID=2760803 RepID=A0ABR8KPQ4_9SPHN|nr:hypothetical protein [Erythrobacter rubeus]MBD2841168.1 hypothetical protein [Erythrobacter rubeus]
MDSDLVIVFGSIIIIVLITGLSINGIVSKVYDYKRSKAGMSAADRANGLKVSEISDRTDMIEDRLRLLERLATDRGQLLSDEIELLRGDSEESRKLENSQ